MREDPSQRPQAEGKVRDKDEVTKQNQKRKGKGKFMRLRPKT